jgi:hypothetical protein
MQELEASLQQFGILESPGVPAGRGNIVATGNGEFVNLSSVTT